MIAEFLEPKVEPLPRTDGMGISTNSTDYELTERCRHNKVIERIAVLTIATAATVAIVIALGIVAVALVAVFRW